jgi:hypothetical protein
MLQKYPVTSVESIGGQTIRGDLCMGSQELFSDDTPNAWRLSTRPFDREMGSRQKPPRLVRAVARHLLAIAGERVDVVRLPGPVLKASNLAVLTRGQLFSQEGLRRRGDTPRRCYDNSLLLWAHHPRTYSLVFGYAFTARDQVWRGHAWVLDTKGRIIETVSAPGTARDLYDGAALTDSELVTACAAVLGTIGPIMADALREALRRRGA